MCLQFDRFRLPQTLLFLPTRFVFETGRGDICVARRIERRGQRPHAQREGCPFLDGPIVRGKRLLRKRSFERGSNQRGTSALDILIDGFFFSLAGNQPYDCLMQTGS